MRELIQRQPDVIPAIELANRSVNSLQRKCSCGGASGFGHTCAPCQAKELAGPQSSLSLGGTRDPQGHTPHEIQTQSLPKMPQPKLTVGQPNDSYEQEADQVAEQVMRMPAAQTLELHAGSSSATAIQRACLDCEKENDDLIQRTESTSHVPEVTPSITARIADSAPGGQPLTASAREFFEPRFGHDFSKVRVHADTTASKLAHSLGARAFTLGSNIFFGQGQYSPDTASGKSLMAHELTHTIQQSRESAQTSLMRTPDFRIQRQEEGAGPAPGGGEGLGILSFLCRMRCGWEWGEGCREQCPIIGGASCIQECNRRLRECIRECG